MKVCIVPEFSPDSLGGVAAHIRGLKKHIPKFGVEFVDSIDQADLVHVQATGESPRVDIYTNLAGFLPRDYGLIADIVAGNMASARRVITIGNWMAGALRDKYGVDPVVIPHGVDWKEFDAVPEGEFCEAYGIKPGFFLWAKCGLHDNLFNPADFIRLAEAYPEYQFVMTLFPEGRNPPPNVEVVGLLEWGWMKRALKDSGCLVWPHIDYFPIQMLEGWACSKPILGYDLGGVGEMIEHKKTGYLAPSEDFEELAKGLEYILEHGRELGEAGRKEVEQKYNWESVARQTANLYKEVFEEKRREGVHGEAEVLAPSVSQRFNQIRPLKLLLIGLDAFDYELFTCMNPSWLSDLRQASNYGIARPDHNLAITGPSWTSILTGLKIETHGVTDQCGRENWEGYGSKSFSTVNRPYIWDLLNDAGLSCGVMNFPVTWPAPEINGWFISGWWAELSYTPKILAYLLRDYVMDYLDTVVKETKAESKEAGIAEWIESEETLEEATEQLMKVVNTKLHTLIALPPVDCLLVQFPILDRLGHKMIGEEDRAYCFEQMVKMMLQSEWVIKVLLERYEPEFLALISDHGWRLNVEKQWIGDIHSENGIWLIKGPTVAEGERIDIVNYDFLPSLLRAMGLPVPEDMDGQPKVILKKDVEIVAERLKVWGYSSEP